MSLRPVRIFIPVIIFVSLQHPGITQENAAFQQPYLDYRLAGDMFRNRNFGNARQLYHEISSDINNRDAEITTGAIFREAISAAELNHPDAPAKISNFIGSYPENALTGEASLYLGKIYFRDNKYKDALKAFQGVEASGLGKTGKEELYFMTGYCQLKSGDPAAAKAYFQRVNNRKSSYYDQSKYFLAHIDYIQGNYKQALKAFEELESDPLYRKVIPLYKIQIYHYLKDYEKIRAIGPAMTESSGPTDKAEVARITGNAFFNTGDFENAAKYLGIYEQASRKPLSRDDHYMLGFVNYKSGDYKNAIGNFQQAVKQNDALSQIASYYLGVCYNETGQKKNAGNAFLSACKNGIDEELADEALFNYIKISLESPFNPYNESISLLETYLEEHPDSPRADEGFGYLSRLYLSSGNYKQALASIESAGEKNARMQEAYQEILFYRAAELFIINDLEGSLDLYKKASALTSDESVRVESLYWTGEIFYRKNDYPEAIKYYKDFLDSKQAKRSALYGSAFYNLGYSYFNSKEYDNTIAQLGKFLETSQSSNPEIVIDAYLRMGDAYFITKQYEKAISNYDRVILSKDASMDYALYQKGLSEGARGEYIRKIDIMKVLINNYPKSPFHDDALYETALAFILLNEDDQALAYFEKLAQGYPPGSKALQASLRKGFIYFSRNDYNQAISSFKNVIEQFPASQEAQEALAALKNIYIETGEVDKYYSYAKGLSFAEVSTSEEDGLTYEVAENLYMQGNYDQAVNSFKKYLDSFPDGAFVANASYYQAEIAFRTGRLDEAEERVYSLAENFAAHDYWVAKGFILLSDIFLKNGNEFQARQTLESVIENYKGPELGDVARQKLNDIIN